MTKKRCKPCQEYTQHKPYRSNLFKYKGERVKTCKRCGHLRTDSHRELPDSEMIHIPTQKKYKELND